MMLAIKTMIIETANVTPRNWAGNSGSAGDGKVLGFGDDVG